MDLLNGLRHAVADRDLTDLQGNDEGCGKGRIPLIQRQSAL
jgi:hypothetical protein